MAGLLDAVRAFSDREFLVLPERGRALTYREFDERSRALAGRLEALGLGRADRALALLPNSAEYALLYFACATLGATLVPVNPALHPREVAFILRNAGAKLLVACAKTRGLASDAPAGLRRWELPPLEELRGGRCGEAEPRDEAPLVIVFTSGTTAFPKGVAHRLGSLVGNARAFNEAMGLGPEHRFLHLFSLAYSGGFFNQLLSPFLAGASVVMTPGWGPRTALDFWRLPRASGVNALWLNPTMAAALLRLDRDEAGRHWCRENLRRCFVGMAPLHRRLKRDFEAAYGVPLYESYGLSETLLVAALGPKTGAVEGAVGPPLPGVELRLAPDGEILVKTPYLAAGFLDLEASKLRSPEGGWFATGDLGTLSPEGFLSVTGRKKDVIVRGGFNVSPAAVEEVLLEHEAVAQAAVVGIPDDLAGERVVGVVCLKPGVDGESARRALEAHCRANLAATSRPSALLLRVALPTGATGKVLKRELRQWAIGQLA